MIGDAILDDKRKGTAEGQSNFVLPPDFGAMIRPHIPISPFVYSDLDLAKNDIDEDEAEQRLQEHLGRKFALTSSGRHALSLVLSDAGVGPDDTVTILTTTGNTYVSGCVTQTIGRVCHWSMRIEPSTKLILVIHEWGIPYPKMNEALETGIPVVEDCAYAFASGHGDQAVGRQGHYAFYSLPKFFPINFGGLVCGLRRQVHFKPEHKRAILNVIGAQICEIASIREARLSAWRYLQSRFREIGCEPALSLGPNVIPGVFMFRPHADVVPEEIKQAYQRHGIEASVFYPWHAVYVPCHQRLTPGAMDYMALVYEQARGDGS